MAGNIIKFSKITYRQYLALTYCISKYNSGDKISTDEIKKQIGFTTDRMIDITFKALQKKGLINYYGLQNEPIMEITEATRQVIEQFTDPLLVIDKITPFSEIKKKIKYNEEKVALKAKVPLTSDYDTIKYLNSDAKIFHRWYGYLEDFPSSLVWDKIETNLHEKAVILDPFSGSGTTAIVAKMMGHHPIGIDVSPLAAFVSKAKTTWDIDIKLYKKYSSLIINELVSGNEIFLSNRLLTKSLQNMEVMERNQWLKPLVQNYVSYVKESIYSIEDEDIRNLLTLCTIESAKEASNVAFCPGTSFYPFRKRAHFVEAFKNQVSFAYEDLMIAQRIIDKTESARIINEDCRIMHEEIESHSVDYIFTSPPYPNDLEYTRQTKLDLYLSELVESEADIQKIKKKMVKGSTKVIFKESNSSELVKEFNSIQGVVDSLTEAFEGKNWGWDYPRMVNEYFGDMYLVFKAVDKVLSENGKAEFVVGDQSYKNVLIPVGDILCELADELGFKYTKELFRVRSSTIHDLPLNEDIVIISR